MAILQIVNRTSEEFQFKFNSEYFYVPPGPDSIPMDEHAAWHGFLKSAYGVDQYTNIGKFKLGIVGFHPIEMIEESDAETRRMKSYLDHDIIADVEGKKYISKSVTNRMEITDPGPATSHVVLSNKAEG